MLPRRPLPHCRHRPRCHRANRHQCGTALRHRRPSSFLPAATRPRTPDRVSLRSSLRLRWPRVRSPLKTSSKAAWPKRCPRQTSRLKVRASSRAGLGNPARPAPGTIRLHPLHPRNIPPSQAGRQVCSSSPTYPSQRLLEYRRGRANSPGSWPRSRARRREESRRPTCLAQHPGGGRSLRLSSSSGWC